MAGSTKRRNCESGPSGATGRWKALRVVEAAPFDEEAGKAILVLLLNTSRQAGDSEERDRERQRSVTSLVRGRKRRGQVAPSRKAGCSAPRGSGRHGRSWERAVKRGPTWGRIVERRSGIADVLGRKPGAVGDRHGGSRAPGSRAIHGCSCRESVAEVGKTHLLPTARGEPRGKPRRGEVARGGGSLLHDEGSLSASGERVRGGRRVNEQ